MFHAHFEYSPCENEVGITSLLDSNAFTIHILPLGETTKSKRQVHL